MVDRVPGSLFHTSRAQCPDCGAPVALRDAGAMVSCHYCGCASLVERRLRTLEPTVDPAIETADAPPDAARHWAPSHVIPAVSQDESHCPTCGCELKCDEQHSVLRCPQCGTESKAERRLVRKMRDEIELIDADADDSDWMKLRTGEAQTLIHRIIKGQSLPDRVRAARELEESWAYVNANTARRLPDLMNVLRRCDPVLEVPLAQVIGKMLCHEDRRLHYATLRAAERFTFDVNGSRHLLLELGLGTGICLKLLLDSADYLAQAGAIEHACVALWACNQIFERRYPQRDVCAEIILYRLLYLRGPVQAWAIQLAQGQLGLGYRYPTPTLLRFIDDCQQERPELVPHLMKCFYTGGAPTDGDYLNHLSFLDELRTKPAKSAALSQLGRPPESGSDQTLALVLEKLVEFASDPELAAGATSAIVTIIEAGMTIRKPVHEMVMKHGDQLPEEVRRSYLRSVPNSPLLTPLPDQNWQPERPGPKSTFDQQIEEWTQMWDQGIRRAVAAYQEQMRAAKEYWGKQCAP